MSKHQIGGTDRENKSKLGHLWLDRQHTSSHAEYLENTPIIKTKQKSSKFVEPIDLAIERQRLEGLNIK